MPVTLSSTLGVLTAMFTPAVLVSACGSLILTTSQRLSRSLDRQRAVAQQLRSPTMPLADAEKNITQPNCGLQLGGRSSCNR